MMIKSSKLSLSEPVSPILFWNINILKNSNCLALFQDKLSWNEWALNSVISHEIFSVKSLYSMFIAHKSDSGGWSAHTGIPCAVLCNRVWSWDCKSHTLQHDTREFGWMCVWVNLTIRKKCSHVHWPDKSLLSFSGQARCTGLTCKSAFTKFLQNRTIF